MIRDKSGRLGLKGQLGPTFYMSSCLGKDGGVNVVYVSGTSEEETDTI